MYQLIITEKPSAANKIAYALADTKPKMEKNNGVQYFTLTHGGKDVVVASAVGHLYGLEESKKTQWSYPVFDIEWAPPKGKDQNSSRARKFIKALTSLAKKADSFVIATDFDIEGEVIGLNVLRYACKKKDGMRMKFSTMIKPDLIKSYNDKSKTLAWGQANAGLTRHELDWYYGINLSRALTSSVKAIGRFKILSTGRVQGPALKILVDREKEIRDFKPVPYWLLRLNGTVRVKDIEALHANGKFWKEDEATTIYNKVKGNDGVVDKVDRNEFNQAPPTPFDLTTLQTEAYRSLRISPKQTLAIAQELYIGGLISYPRTSSQELPPAIGYKQIIEQLKQQNFYTQLCNRLLSKKTLNPNNGKKTDPAHPAIYPTGSISEISGQKAKIYDLIVRRFLATFADPATRETVKITIKVKDEPFISEGTRTVVKGWHEFYGPHVKMSEQELPPAEAGDQVKVKKLTKDAKKTEPPKRYTPASIIRELEKRNLGTKATRAQIVDTLVQRNYVQGTSLEATDLGIKIASILSEYSPTILDEELTRHFEEELQDIHDQKITSEKVLKEAKDILLKLLKEFKSKEKNIGEKLYEAHIEGETKNATVGECPVCHKGTLMMRRGKFGRFVGCDAYPDCTATFKLPPTGLIKQTDKTCESCGFPVLQVILKGKKPQEVCINPECKSKYADGEAGAEAKAVAKGEIEKPCPKCKEGKLMLRTSVYGKFYGCSRYPKCRHTEKLENGNNNTK